METSLPVALCLLFLVPLPLGESWEAPWFCHKLECPEYTVVNTYENFEERLYNSSRWITTQVASTSFWDVSAGFLKLYNFIQGDNNEQMVIPTTRPGLVTVIETGENEEPQVSVSFYITPDTVLPQWNDAAIREEIRPNCTVYVRDFKERASVDVGIENKEKLVKDLEAAGILFDQSRFEGAGYDSPFTLVNLHSEVWVYADEQL